VGHFLSAGGRPPGEHLSNITWLRGIFRATRGKSAILRNSARPLARACKAPGKSVKCVFDGVFWAFRRSSRVASGAEGFRF
jgi:hypothetical protein